jgi:histidinol-phosphate phosphatase family protein
VQAVIIAGGQGSRLRDRIGPLPKAMVDVGGKPVIAYQVELARKHDVRDIVVLTGFGAAFIEEYLGKGERWGVRITYRRDTRPLGTAGAVLAALDCLDDVFLVMYGDTMLNVDLSRLARAHRTEFGATLFVHPNDHPFDSDLVEVDEDNRIRSIHPYPHPEGSFFPNLVNAALYAVSKWCLPGLVESARACERPFDFGKHAFPTLLAKDVPLQAYRSREYIKDAGTGTRLDKVRADYETGRIQRGSLQTAVPAVFLDRDGTIIYDRQWLTTPEQVELLPGTAAAIRLLNASGRLVVIVTNQPVVARGDCTYADVHRVHARLEWLLGLSHAYVEAIYFCPHHPDAGFPNERTELKVRCTCRKPETGLLQRASEELNIDLNESFLIGDTFRDIQAARNFGVRPILVARNQNEFSVSECDYDGRRDFDLLAAVQHIVKDDVTRNDHYANPSSH